MERSQLFVYLVFKELNSSLRLPGFLAILEIPFQSLLLGKVARELFLTFVTSSGILLGVSTKLFEKHPSTEQSLNSLDARATRAEKRASFAKLARSGNREKLKLLFPRGIPRLFDYRHRASLHTNYPARSFFETIDTARRSI